MIDVRRLTLVEATDELDGRQTQLDTIDERWKGKKIVSAFAGGGYDHSRYYKKLEKQKLKRRIKSLSKRISKLKSE